MADQEDKRHILIVDDTPANIQVLGSILSTQEYTANVARNGEEALAKAAKAVPDLILLDVMMPGIDGYETCRQIKIKSQPKTYPGYFPHSLQRAGRYSQRL